jgi:hypothetical protein
MEEILFLPDEDSWGTGDLRWVHSPVAAFAEGDGETHCSKVRPNRGRTKFAEPSGDMAYAV